MKAAAHIFVRGMVQGVGFRYFVQMCALRLGIRGFVRNVHDGKVEIVAEGERGAVEELIKEVKVGPRMAHVADLHIEWKSSDDSFTTFEIR